MYCYIECGICRYQLVFLVSFSQHYRLVMGKPLYVCLYLRHVCRHNSFSILDMRNGYQNFFLNPINTALGLALDTKVWFWKIYSLFCQSYDDDNLNMGEDRNIWLFCFHLDISIRDSRPLFLKKWVGLNTISIIFFFQ